MKVKLIFAWCLLALSFVSFQAVADNSNGFSNEDCPVGLATGMELDQEFGEGAAEITRCIQRRHNVKMVMQINKFCRDSVPNEDCAKSRAYGLAQLNSIIRDYEITHGMMPGVDYEIVAVVHGSGGLQMLNNSYYENQFQSQVENLISKGVKFYFCQNTIRGFIVKKHLFEYGEAVDAIIPGVEFVTGGLTALADFQSQGYVYIQP